MVEDLLQNLAPAAPVAGNLVNIESLLRVIMRELTWAVEGMKGSALLFENVWRRLVLDVARGRTAEVHAVRDRFCRAFEERLNLLQQAHTLAATYRNSGREDVPDPDTLLPEITGLERFRGRVFDRWQSPEDLEDLAARDYPLTTADLDRIGPNRRPPASYYAEEGKPC